MTLDVLFSFSSCWYMSDNLWTETDITFHSLILCVHFWYRNTCTLFCESCRSVSFCKQHLLIFFLLQITVDIHIIYFVIPEDLKLLHDEYDVNYHPIITSSALTALKVLLLVILLLVLVVVLLVVVLVLLILVLVLLILIHY